jgi:glutathione S-transferase
LNYKKIAYHTVWVEYPDIEELCKKIGAPPSGTKPDGSPFYTLPVIYDPSTNTTLSESILIAEYLDARYPDTPRLIPRGTRALQHMFSDAYLATISPVFQFGIPLTHKFLNTSSQEYFRIHKEKAFGKTLEALLPTGDAKDAEWTKVKKAFDTVDGWLQKAKVDGPWFLGEQHSFVDFVVGARLMWLRRVFGEDSQEWADIKTWNEGRWLAFVEGIKKHEVCTTC